MVHRPGLGSPSKRNDEMLENDGNLNEHAMFRGSQGPKNETNMVPEEQRRENRSTLAGWLVGWWLGWCLGWCLVVAWGGPGGGGGVVRFSLSSHLGAPGEIIEGEQRAEKTSHSLTLPLKGGWRMTGSARQTLDVEGCFSERSRGGSLREGSARGSSWIGGQADSAR